MAEQDDEVFKLFLEESREHLESIEEDLLALEAQGESVKEDLINKVFRAAHTIKGGSGFFGLEKVKELAHSMENVLGLIRSHELIPNPSIVSSLLDGADMLRQMLTQTASAEEKDISGIVMALKNCLSPTSNDQDAGKVNAQNEKSAEEAPLVIFNDEGVELFSVCPETLRMAQRMDKGGAYVYLLKYYLLRDIHIKERNPWDVIQELTSISYFIDSALSFESAGTLEQSDVTPDLPLYILCATVLEPTLVCDCLGLTPKQVKIILAKPLDEKKPTPAPHTSVSASSPTSSNSLGNPETKFPPVSKKPELKPEAAAAHEAPEFTAATRTKSVEAEPVLPQSEGSEKNSAEPASNAKGKDTQDSTVRVHLSLLDKLMTLAGELVLTRNELLQNVGEKNIERMAGTAQRVDTITSDLQEAIMATRMQSVGIVFSKFKRVVRDLSRELGKKVQLNIEGEEVEMDKTIIEAIGDPLTHLVRNSVDHGIENPDVRKRKGKPEEGRLDLRAFHEAGQVIIEIIDDGKGIDTKRVREKAIEKGMMTAAQASSLSEKDAINLIFAPGFSTAEKITDVSGRGVGMDVVSSNLQAVGGVVDIATKAGEGTTIRIKLPLTLAIIPSLLIAAEKDRFAIPQVNLLELVRVPAKDVKKRIENIGSATVMRLRGELLPLVRIKDVLHVDDPTYIDPFSGTRMPDQRKNIADRRTLALDSTSSQVDDPRCGLERRGLTSTMQIAVVTTGDFSFGIIVDALLDTEEIVVKPLGVHLKHIQEYAGATILGDGSVAFILDIGGICQSAQLQRQQALLEKRKKDSVQAKVDADEQSLLLVRNGLNERLTIPLSLVTRIEKISADQVLTVGNKRAMTYRGKSLLLFKVEDVAQVEPLPESPFYFVVVYIIGGREVGLMVAEILDILKTRLEVDDLTHRQNGILGSVVYESKIVLMLDIYGIAEALAPDLVSASKKQEIENHEHTVLIVEDSTFFLNQMRIFVEKAGYKVLTAEDGRKGLATLENCPEPVDLILTDIEMPNMNGLEMTRAIRASAKFQHLPIIAVTSVAGEDAEREGKAAGVDEYLIKLDREQIINSCHRVLSQQKHSSTGK